MKQTQFKKKLKELTKEIRKKVEKESLRLFNSGGVDVTKYEDNYLLPKIILSVALKNEAWQCAPLDAYNRREAKNLENF